MSKRTKTSYDLFSDPGHGWLCVSMEELKRLNILDKVTDSSYRRDNTAFLEEDQDLSTFMDAKKSIDNVVIKIKNKVSNKTSRIRNYESFTPVIY